MHRLIIADDEEINREILEAGLNDLFEISQAGNGREALDLLYYEGNFDAVLLDLNMPEMSGFDVLKDLKDTGLIEKIPVMVVTSTNAEAELMQAYELGAVDVISKPYNLNFLRRRLLNTIELYSQRNKLSEIVEEKTKELIRQNNRLVEAMADIVEFRSNESGTHVKRVSSYTKIIMEGLVHEYPEYKDLRSEIENISFAATLHDLGKIAIPDSILNKPGKYTPEEFEVMKNHTIYGYEQIRSLKDIMSPKLYEFSLDIAWHHHERYDGKGYPEGLKGEEISIWSQAAGLADVYDALTSDRCYKKAFTHEVACDMILSGKCGAFNPKVIAVFDKLKMKFNALRLGIFRKKILIVDDTEIDRQVLRTILSKQYDVVEADSGMIAFSQLKAKENDFDGVIIDVFMPNMDGFDLIRKLGKPWLATTPVLMCSVDVNKDAVKRAAEFGVRAFLKKPFEIDTLLKKVENIIGK